MTRKSKREIERFLANYERGRGEIVTVVHADPETGEFVDEDGAPVEPTEDANLVVVIRRARVMRRERALEENQEILTSVDGPPGTDLVRVSRQGVAE